MNDLLLNNQFNLPEQPQTEEELFHSFIDSVNNAISNKVQYDFNKQDEVRNFIDNFIEEIVFCMNFDEEFQVELLDIPSDFRFERKKDDVFYSLKNMPELHLVSQANRKVAIKIQKNPTHGAACMYKFRPNGAPYPLYAVNFEYSTDENEKEIALYKKVALDYIELKNINSMPSLLKVVTASFKTYKARVCQ